MAGWPSLFHLWPRLNQYSHNKKEVIKLAENHGYSIYYLLYFELYTLIVSLDFLCFITNWSDLLTDCKCCASYRQRLHSFYPIQTTILFFKRKD